MPCLIRKSVMIERYTMRKNSAMSKNAIGEFGKRAHTFWLRYRRNKAGVLGAIGLVLIILVSVFASLITDIKPLSNQFSINQPPNAVNWFGTDDLGRDVFSRTLYGGRMSLIVGVLASLVSTAVGILIGAVAGYMGKGVDLVLMKFTELFQVIPQFFLAIMVAAFFGPSFYGIILIIGLLGWPSTARLVRAEFLTLKSQEFVTAARSIGCRNGKIIFSEILPGAMPQVIVNASLRMASAILMEASLNFFGLGDPSTISWGKMLNDSKSLLRNAPWTSIFPGIAILLTVLCINLVGDALNDALNPKLRER